MSIANTPTYAPRSQRTSPVGSIGAVHLAALHSRYQFLETIRIPIAVVATTVFPALSLLFFVIPQAELASDPMIASAAAAQLSVFAIMSVCLFQLRRGHRRGPHDAVGLLPQNVAGWTRPTLYRPAAQRARLRRNGPGAPAGLGCRTHRGHSAGVADRRCTSGLHRYRLPFLGLGLAIGHRLSSKASLGVANVLLLPMAFAGGLFLPPELFPHWLEIASRFLPSRAGRDLLVGTVTGEDIPLLAIVVLLAWTGFAVGLAVLAFRRDEGQRFR